MNLPPKILIKALLFQEAVNSIQNNSCLGVESGVETAYKYSREIDKAKTWFTDLMQTCNAVISFYSISDKEETFNSIEHLSSLLK